MATVYRARDTELRRDVAVKVLFPHLARKKEVVARFHREARAAAALDHDHILRVFDVGGGARAATNGDGGDDPAEVDPPYIVMELVRGETLREVAERGEPLLAEVVASVGVAMCSALAEAHRAGIVHRDVKPGNILVADDGRLVLTDFGVARVQDEDSSLVTRTGALLGTPSFMSPEQALGAELDARSDLYSLGATLYQLASGSVPFAGPTAKVVSKIARGDHVPVARRNPALGPVLPRIIDRLMAVEPDDRYADAAEAEAALAAVVEASRLGEPDEVLAAYFADPARWLEEARPAVVRACLGRAEEAADAGALPRAMALCDRVLGLEAENAEALALVERLGHGRRRAQLVGLVAAAAAVAVAAGAWVMWPAGEGEDGARGQGAGVVEGESESAGEGESESESAGEGEGESESESESESAGEGEGESAGERDAGVPAIARQTTDASPPADARRRAVTRVRPPRRRPDAAVAVAAPAIDAAPVAVTAPVDAAAPPASASVQLVMDAWCDVTIDGTAYGRADPRKRIELAPGKHAVVCSQGRGMSRWSRTVTLKPGEHRRLEGKVLESVAVVIAVRGGESVRIAGKTHRNGATVELRPARYRVDVLAGEQRVGGAWVTISRGGRCTLRDRPALGCYR